MWSRNVQKLCAIDENRTHQSRKKRASRTIRNTQSPNQGNLKSRCSCKDKNSKQQTDRENLVHPKVSSDCFKCQDRNDKRLRSVPGRRGSSPLGASLPEGRHLPKDLLDSAEPEAPQRWHGRLKHTNKPGSLPRWSRIHGLDIRSRMIKRQSCQHHFWSPKAF